MNNKEILQNYNNRLSTKNISLNDILDRINTLPSGGGSSSEQCAPNIFIQPNEPKKFEGIWINSDNDNILNEVAITTEITQRDAVLNWTKTMLTPLPNTFNNGRCVSIGTDIYIFGGGGNGSSSASRFLAYKYDTLTDTYIQLTNIPYSYYDGVIGVSGTNIYLFGGIYNERKAYKYDTLTNEYTQLTDLPFNSVNGYSASVGTDVYIFASYNAAQTAYKYNTLNDTYQQIANTPTATAYGKATSIGTNIYIFGSNNNRQTAYKYDTLTNTYVRIHDIPFGFFNGGCVNDGTYVYLLGTEVTSVKKYVYKYDPSNDTYSQLTSLPNDFWNGDATSIDHKLYVLGGANTPNNILVASTIELDTNVNITDGLVIYSPVGDKHLYNTELFSSDDINNRVLFGFNALLHVSPAGTNIVENDSYYGTGSQWLKCSDMKLTPNTPKEKILQDKDVTILKNGTQTIVPDIGFDGLTSVHVTTSVPMTGETITKGLIIDEVDNDGYVIKMTLIGFDQIPVDILNVGGNNNLFNKSINEIVISGNPTSIGQGAFNSSKMKKTNIPDSVTAIGNYTFANCQYLNLEKLPDNLTTIGKEAFYELGFHISEGLGIKTIPDGVTELQEATFRRCTNLRQISMRNVVTIYSSYGNGGCFANAGLRGIWIGSAIRTIQPYAFINCTQVKKFFIDLPRATVEGMANYNVTFSNGSISADKIICNDDPGFITKEEFDAIDWSTYTE